MSETIADYPAYRIYKPYAGRKFKHGDVIALPWQSASHGMQWHFYTLGTVAGYAMSNGECPLEAVARAEAYNAAAPKWDQHQLYWVNANPVTLTAQRQAKREVPGFEFGQTIVLQGHLFTLQPANNQNCALLPVPPEEVSTTTPKQRADTLSREAETILTALVAYLGDGPPDSTSESMRARLRTIRDEQAKIAPVTD